MLHEREKFLFTLILDRDIWICYHFCSVDWAFSNQVLRGKIEETIGEENGVWWEKKLINEINPVADFVKGTIYKHAQSYAVVIRTRDTLSF